MDRPTSLDLLDAAIEDVAAMEYILLGDLRDLVDEPFDGVTLKWLKAVIDALLETLSQEFARQDDGDGYLQEVVDSDPNWAHYVDRLAEERRAIFGKLRALRLQLDGLRSLKTVVPALRSELKGWMWSITALHRHERRLLQTAFNLDVGIGD
ncbi:MAG: hypothetical protein ACE5KM_20905 [Planctomycetaceae bacterium]